LLLFLNEFKDILFLYSRYYIMSNYWISGVLVFLFVLSVHKYKDIDFLKNSVRSYIELTYEKYRLQRELDEYKEELDISLEEYDRLNVKHEKSQELQKLIVDFVVSNPDIFSAVEVYNNKDE